MEAVNLKLKEEKDNFKEIYSQLFFILISRTKDKTILSRVQVIVEAIESLLKDDDLRLIFVTLNQIPWIPNQFGGA